jgi:nucleotide-binding universal stress UspA family protein
MTGSAGAAIQPGASKGMRPSLFPRVLCGVDGKEGGYVAVAQAASLAGEDGHLTLLAVTSFRAAGAIRSPALGPARVTEILDRAGEIAREATVPYTCEVDPATPPAGVVSEWGSRYDLLSLGAPATSWLTGFFSEGVGDTALAALPTPLLLARAATAGTRFGETIVVASDCLAASHALVELAARAALLLGSGLTLVHAIGPGPHLHRHVLEQERALDEQRGRLQEMLPVERFDVVTVHGHAHEAIVSTATSLAASLIVLGSRGLDGMRAVGSVGRRVAHEAQCSVLLVPPERLAS